MKSIKDGRWFNIESAEQHKTLKECGNIVPKLGFARVQIGTYTSPGRYMLLQYNVRCPRNCCYDNVNEVLTEQQVIDIALKEIIELYEILIKDNLVHTVYLIEQLVEHDTVLNLDYKIPFAVCITRDQAEQTVERLEYGFSYKEIKLEG